MRCDQKCYYTWVTNSIYDTQINNSKPVHFSIILNLHLLKRGEVYLLCSFLCIAKLQRSWYTINIIIYNFWHRFSTVSVFQISPHNPQKNFKLILVWQLKSNCTYSKAHNRAHQASLSKKRCAFFQFRNTNIHAIYFCNISINLFFLILTYSSQNFINSFFFFLKMISFYSQTFSTVEKKCTVNLSDLIDPIMVALKSAYFGALLYIYSYLRVIVHRSISHIRNKHVLISHKRFVLLFFIVSV